jgi:hypothetical protein
MRWILLLQKHGIFVAEADDEARNRDSFTEGSKGSKDDEALRSHPLSLIY